jgi:hypothetical protein
MLTMPIKLIAVFLLAASTLTVNVAAAASIVDVERTRAGWWTDKFLASGPDNNNYLTGFSDDDRIHRSYFQFDLSAVSATVTSAELTLYLPNLSQTVQTSDPWETFALFDFTGDIDFLTNIQFDPPKMQATYADLGSGIEYGSTNIAQGTSGVPITIVLNADAIAAINAAGGDFVIGAAVTSLSGGAEPEMVFGFSGGSTAPTPFLSLTVVPLPPAIWAFLSALGWLGWRARR